MRGTIRIWWCWCGIKDGETGGPKVRQVSRPGYRGWGLYLGSCRGSLRVLCGEDTISSSWDRSCWHLNGGKIRGAEAGGSVRMAEKGDVYHTGGVADLITKHSELRGKGQEISKITQINSMLLPFTIEIRSWICVYSLSSSTVPLSWRWFHT